MHRGRAVARRCGSRAALHLFVGLCNCRNARSVKVLLLRPPCLCLALHPLLVLLVLLLLVVVLLLGGRRLLVGRGLLGRPLVDPHEEVLALPRAAAAGVAAIERAALVGARLAHPELNDLGVWVARAHRHSQRERGARG